MPASQSRQQVGGRGAADVLVTEGDPHLLDEDAVLQRLLEARAQVGVESAVAVPRPGRRARRQAIGGELEGGGRVGQLIAVDGPAREREQPEDPAALRSAPRDAGDDEVVERIAEACVRDLPACREQLLRDERQPARPVCDEDQGGAHRRLAFDRLDQGGKLPSFERREVDLDRPRDLACGRLGEGGVQRVVTDQLVGCPCPDETDTVMAPDATQEGDEGAGSGIGVVEVAERNEDRLALRQAADDAEKGLEDAPLAPLRRRRRRERRERAGLPEPGLDLGEEADHILDVGADQADELGAVEILEHGPQGPDDRAVRLVGARTIGTSADDDERLTEGSDPAGDLGHEPGDADATGPVDEHGRRLAARGHLESRGELDELRVATHEPRAVPRRGHARHSRRGARPPAGSHRPGGASVQEGTRRALAA